MTTVYKLTDQSSQTYNKTTWGPGVTHRGTGKGDLCGPGFIHAYLSPELAVLLNPIHANFTRPKLWECDTEIVKNDKNLKVGGVSLTSLREIPLPIVTSEQRLVFAILCVKYALSRVQMPLEAAKHLVVYTTWAEDTLSGRKEVSAQAAYAAADAAYAAAYATATYAAAYATADAAQAAYAAADAAYAAAYATAYAAARAAAQAAYAELDLVAIAREAMRWSK